MPPLPKCRSCASVHRAEIDQRLIDGESPRMVSAWLLETHGERIPFQALNSHRAAHVRQAIKEETQRQHHELTRPLPVPSPPSELPAPPDPVARVVAQRMHHLDQLAWVAEQAMSVAEQINLNLDGKPSMGAVTLYLGCLREVREVAMSTHEILEGNQPVEVNAHIDSLGELLGLALSPPAS